MGGSVSKVVVTLKDFHPKWAGDVNVLLVGPSGQAMRLMENAGTGQTSHSDLTFSDDAAVLLPATGGIPTGTYKPTAYPPATTYPSPAPTPPYATVLSAFNGTDANGTW